MFCWDFWWSNLLQIFVLLDNQRVTLRAEVDPSLIERNKEEFIRFKHFFIHLFFTVDQFSSVKSDSALLKELAGSVLCKPYLFSLRGPLLKNNKYRDVWIMCEATFCCANSKKKISIYWVILEFSFKFPDGLFLHHCSVLNNITEAEVNIEAIFKVFDEDSNGRQITNSEVLFHAVNVKSQTIMTSEEALR